MSYLVLARKWRPRTFAELVGQDHVKRALTNALQRQTLHHAYLFTGTRGVGKTTIARIFAKALNCERGITPEPCGGCGACKAIDEGRFLDLIEVDAASRTGVDDTRDLLENVQYAPVQGRFKVYLIDEVHMFSNSSFNALLKTLEEPPSHVKFLFATTDPQKLPITVLSRCLRFNLHRLPSDLIASQLGTIAEQEGATADPGSLRLLATAADGSMRDGLSLMDQAIAYLSGALSEAEVREMLGVTGQESVGALLRAVQGGEGAKLFATIEQLSRQVVDFGLLLNEVLGVLHATAVLQMVPGATPLAAVDEELGAALAAELKPDDVQLYYQIALAGKRDLPLAADPRSGFEMTMLRMLAFRPVQAGQRLPVEGEPVSAQPKPPVTQRAVGAATPATWEATVATLNVSGMVKELALNSVLAGMSADRVELILPKRQRTLLSDNSRNGLEEALSQAAGRSIKLRVTVEDSADKTPAQASQERQLERLAQAQESLLAEPLVAELQQTFGAELDAREVKPLKRGHTQ